MLDRHMSTVYNLTLTTACASSSPTYWRPTHAFCFTPPSLYYLCSQLATWSCPLPLIPLSPTLSLVTYHGLPPEFGVHLGHSIMPPHPYPWWPTINSPLSLTYILATWSCLPLLSHSPYPILGDLPWTPSWARHTSLPLDPGPSGGVWGAPCSYSRRCTSSTGPGGLAPRRKWCSGSATTDRQCSMKCSF